MKREAVLDENGTVCLYTLRGNGKILDIKLYGKAGMKKQHREESETSEDPEDFVPSEHKELGYIYAKVNRGMGYAEVSYSEAFEASKGYGKLLYLKLAKWCLQQDIHHIVGLVVNTEAMPILTRSKIPGVHHRAWVHESFYKNEKKTIETPKEKGVHFREEVYPYGLSQKSLLRVTNKDLTLEQWKALIPCYVDTVLPGATD
jgi:hypothetical protein